MAGLTKRKQTWHLRMRVPRRYRAIESRSEITRSLRTTSRKEAFVRLLTVEAIVMGHICQSTPKYDWKLISYLYQ